MHPNTCFLVKVWVDVLGVQRECYLHLVRQGAISFDVALDGEPYLSHTMKSYSTIPKNKTVHVMWSLYVVVWLCMTGHFTIPYEQKKRLLHFLPYVP